MRRIFIMSAPSNVYFDRKLSFAARGIYACIYHIISIKEGPISTKDIQRIYGGRVGEILSSVEELEQSKYIDMDADGDIVRIYINRGEGLRWQA